MDINFENKVALVTGAGSGLGFATAKAFAEAGAKIALLDWNGILVTEAADSLASKGYDVVAITCDVSNGNQVEQAIDRIVENFGRLDVAFNNAGLMNELKSADEQSRPDHDKVMGINLGGVWACMKSELQQMEKQGSGAIVNCSSIGGIRGGAERGIYHATKYGVLGLTTSAAIEWAPKGIRINAVCPGTFKTPLVDRLTEDAPSANEAIMAKTPIKRMGRPDELADAVLWLCSDRASYVVGHALVIDGGLTI